jgi:MerR family transcriptional regulator, light-induced transcriptional regulator
MNNRALTADGSALAISAVERSTGLSKETLRVWERRYKFPAPQRAAGGERAYPAEQVEKLRLLKRLVDLGLRPGRIVGMSIEALQRQLDERVAAEPRVQAQSVHGFLDTLKAHDVDGLRGQLRDSRERLGAGPFVADVVAPLNTLVGESWMRGQLHVFEEHLYTESVQIVLREALSALPPGGPSGRPRVLLSTFPAEPHGLGLLMAEVLLGLEGARCVSLGVGTPLWDIVLAAQAQAVDVVALSFSGCMNPNQVVAGLTELRAKLPEALELWAGGAAPTLHRRPVPGVRSIADLEQIAGELLRWRQAARRA